MATFEEDFKEYINRYWSGMATFSQYMHRITQLEGGAK